MNTRDWSIVLLTLFFPALIIQVRYLLYFGQKVESRSQLRDTLIESVPHDLAVVGMAFGFAAYIFASRTNPHIGINYPLAGLIVGALTLPLIGFYVMALYRSGKVRLVLGILVFLLGAGSLCFVAIRAVS